MQRNTKKYIYVCIFLIIAQNTKVNEPVDFFKSLHQNLQGLILFAPPLQ